MTGLASQSCPRLRVEGDASLICLACSVRDRRCHFLVSGPSWRQFHFFILPRCCTLSSLMVFALDWTSAPTGSPLLQGAHSVHGAFIPAGYVGVGLWLRMAGLGGSSWYPGKSRSVIH